MTDLVYGTNPGCVAVVSASGGTPGQCGGVEAPAVRHWFERPRPAHWERLYVCEFHARGRADAEPLTDADRRIIVERREQRFVVLAACGRLDLIGEQ